MDQVRATRMELLARRNQSDLARQGARLLESKREALLRELLEMAGPMVDQLSKLFNNLPRAARSLAIAEALDGRAFLRSMAMAGKRTVNVQFGENTFWGVRLPDVQVGRVRREVDQRGVPPHGLTSRSAEAAGDFEILLEELLKFMPFQIRLSRLGEEVRKTSRRVNALDQVLIPSLENEIKFISQALEEMEREDIFRLRRIKQRREKTRSGDTE